MRYRHLIFRICLPVLAAFLLEGCQPATPGNGTDTSNGDNDGGNPTTDTAQGTWTSSAGLDLQKDGVSLSVGTDAAPSNTQLTLRKLEGLPAGQGFEAGVELGPTGTTFAQPVRITVPIANAAAQTLPVLIFDETTDRWGGAGIDATVSTDQTTASFDVTHFSRYRVWDPPVPPQGTVPIGEGEIISGTGFFEGQPFNTFPNPRAASASLAYSPFGDVFGLSLIQVDVTNPTTGDFITLSAGLHATEIRDHEGVKIAIVSPLGGLSGPSIYNDGGQNKPVAGLMFLRKSATQWLVDVYCAFEGGIIFGLASGDL
jgi:hypothetical protein